MEKSTITPDMTIDQLFATFPEKAQQLAQILTKFGLNCVGCSASTWETLESGVLRHGMSEKDLIKLLDALKKAIEEECDLTTITLTKKAAEAFKKISEDEGKKGFALRFDEKSAGCSGFEYVLGFSEAADENDKVYESHGVKIHVNVHVLPRLLGCVIDYTDGLHAGFHISNPNAKSSCACSKSHGYR
jgi:iron-sulfur cluster assembly accessory protein